MEMGIQLSISRSYGSVEKKKSRNYLPEWCLKSTERIWFLDSWSIDWHGELYSKPASLTLIYGVETGEWRKSFEAWTLLAAQKTRREIEGEVWWKEIGGHWSKLAVGMTVETGRYGDEDCGWAVTHQGVRMETSLERSVECSGDYSSLELIRG